MIYQRGIFFLISILCFCDVAFSAQQTNHPVLITIGREKGELVYHVQKSKTKSEDLVDRLSVTLLQQGREIPVSVVADSDVTIQAISNMRKIMNKVGFAKGRFFFRARGANEMVEIVFGKVEKCPADP